LTSGEIIINKNLTIDGSALASPVTISGNNNSRIFYITSSTVSITRLRFINGASNEGDPGDWDGDGGAIYLQNSSTVTIDRSEFANNHAQYNGGALYIFSNSSATLTNNVFTNNSTLHAGGAIRDSSSPSVIVTGNTFVGNTANEGGAMWASSGTEVLTNNTFYNNTGDGTLYVWEILNLNNNTFVGDDGVTVRNSFADLRMRNNIIGSCLVIGGIISVNINNWIVNGSCSPAFSGDPLLLPLADNGGLTPTAALQPGSAAIDAGDNSTCVTYDQRGVARHDGDGNGVVTCDLGAYEAGNMRCSIIQGSDYAFSNQSNVSIHVNPTAGSDLGCLYVDEVPVNHPEATGITNGLHLRTGKYWHIEGFQSDGTTPANTFNVNLTLPYTSADSTSRVCKWLDGGGAGFGWDCDDAGATHTTYSTGVSVTRSGLNSLSQWAVGQHVGPTAVSLSALSVTSPVPWSAVVAVGLLMGVGLWYTMRKRVKNWAD
ncbi:MAG: right-handed parallel beta-helix repeat-containing protein, partial [Anaerolineales bacterium]|nr:right-handed parallel beta-helix repeat-containing protein [Anaerolineales bacterium]